MKKLRLSRLSKAGMKKKEMNTLRGGCIFCYCDCGCIYTRTSRILWIGLTTDENSESSDNGLDNGTWYG